MSNVKIHYDKKNNVRYIKLSDNNNSYGDEIANGIVIFRDVKTDEVTSVTIMDTPLIYCNNCSHGHLMENSGAIYCDWWQYRVDENGWCYKGEPKGE